MKILSEKFNMLKEFDPPDRAISEGGQLGEVFYFDVWHPANGRGNLGLGAGGNDKYLNCETQPPASIG